MGIYQGCSLFTSHLLSRLGGSFIYFQLVSLKCLELTISGQNRVTQGTTDLSFHVMLSIPTKFQASLRPFLSS